ncbi:fatty acid desaturase [Hydrocarboniphaga sp.]|uniref:fatty acid desaturase n=1 Tax=Hydrocarboniphaga sp. TaxID=2033016 RepID=UPI003D116C2B
MINAVQTRIPHRKVIRSWLVSIARPGYLPALWRVALDSALLAVLLVAAVSLPHLIPRFMAGAAAGLVIGRLFILGHDACHQSLTGNRRLNRWLGRMLLLPSLTPCSLWETGHNVVHHGYTNLRTFDFVWQPKTPEEYRALAPWRQRLERIYRSGWAPGLYYLVEIWWSRMFFPNARFMPTRRRIFVLDSLLVSAVALGWIVTLGVVAQLRGDSILLALLTGFVLPQLVWNCLIGFIVYVHHTHPGIQWHEDKARWSAAQPFVSTTVHLQFKKCWGFDAGSFLHHITEHTAHHVDMTIPLYHLKQAQRILEARMPGQIVVQTFSWPWYFDTAARCKLYDYRRQCWTDFDGHPTAMLQNRDAVDSVEAGVR